MENEEDNGDCEYWNLCFKRGCALNHPPGHDPSAIPSHDVISYCRQLLCRNGTDCNDSFKTREGVYPCPFMHISFCTPDRPPRPCIVTLRVVINSEGDEICVCVGTGNFILPRQRRYNPRRYNISFLKSFYRTRIIPRVAPYMDTKPELTAEQWRRVFETESAIGDDGGF